jgi:phosphopantetheine--protein transferase-like protein
VGSDLQSLAELRAKPSLLGNRAVFTPAERAYCAGRVDPVASFAGLLCAKEACLKALADFDDRPRFTFLDLEIVHATNGRPRLAPGPRLAPWGATVGLFVDLSISHSADYATATAVVQRAR